MIVSIELKVTETNKDKPLIFTSKNLSLKSLDLLHCLNINRFKFNSVYKELKRQLDSFEKKKINELLLYIDRHKNSIKTASLLIKKEDQKTVVKIDLYANPKDLIKLLYVFGIVPMSNGDYIILSNLVLTIVSFCFIYLIMGVLEDANHLFVSLTTFLCFLYASSVPVFAAINLMINKNNQGIMYFDGEFIGKYITFPVLFISISYVYSFILEYFCQYFNIFIPKAYPINFISTTAVILFCFSVYKASTNLMFKLKKYQDKYLVF